MNTIVYITFVIIGILGTVFGLLALVYRVYMAIAGRLQIEHSADKDVPGADTLQGGFHLHPQYGDHIRPPEAK